MTGRHLFAKEFAGERTRHLHILPIEGFHERKELLFRDYLRKHPDLVKEYGELKHVNNIIPTLRARHEQKLPLFNELMTWLEQNVDSLFKMYGTSYVR